MTILMKELKQSGILENQQTQTLIMNGSTTDSDTLPQALNLKTSRICNIKFSNQVRSCKIEQKNSFCVEKDEYVPIPLIGVKPQKSPKWRVCKAAEAIWYDDCPLCGDDANILNMFSKEGYYSKVIRDVVDFMRENMFAFHVDGASSGKIRDYISLPSIYHKILSVDIEKCFIEVCKWNYSNKLTITRAYPIQEIYTKGFKEVEIIASLSCRVKYEITPPEKEYTHDCWNVYKYLLIWGTYRDIDQVWRGLPFLKKQSISGVLGDLRQRGIVVKTDGKWVIDRGKLINRIQETVKSDLPSSVNYAKQFLNIKPSVCKETATRKASGRL